MRILCVFGKYQYGDPDRGIGTEYAAFIPALESLGHEVMHFESWNKSLYNNIADINCKLIDLVELFRPSIMLTVHMTYEIWLETIELISSRGDVATVSWTTDDSWKYNQLSRFIGGSYHAMVTTYEYMLPKYYSDGIYNVMLSQWAVSSDWLNAPISAAECIYQVSFVGAATVKRKSIINELRAKGIEVDCFGYGWARGPVSIEQIPYIMRHSIINLNIADSVGVNQIKARTFEVPGAGGFLLTERSVELENFFDIENEISVFDTVSELIIKINYFLENENHRYSIAISGHQRVIDQHTYINRMSGVINFTIAASKKYKEIRRQTSLEMVVQKHECGIVLSAIKSILVTIFACVFGTRLGKRAARRFVYEVSWRLMGRHTYTAEGWPGRMFPYC